MKISQMTEVQAQAHVKGLEFKAQFTGDKVDAMQLGNDIFIHVNGDTVENIELI